MEPYKANKLLIEYKIEKIKQIYKDDMKKIEEIKGNSVYRIMPVIMKQIVFTKSEVQEES